MKNNNIKLFLTAVITLLFCNGCNNWLDVKPANEQTNDEFWRTKEEVEGMVMGAYSKLREGLDRLVLWSELRSDEVEVGPGAASNEDMNAIRNLEIRPSNSMCNWLNIYSCIGRCNAVIKHAKDAMVYDQTFSQEACDAYIAEAVWLRSLCYFYLVRTFRDVPHVIDPYMDDNQDLRTPKTDGEQIIEHLVANLTANIKNIPIVYEADLWQNKGRATLWAYYALLADIYLWKGDYENCIDMCEKLEVSNFFELLPYASMFENYYPGNSNECIYELQYSSLLNQGNYLYGWFYGSNNSHQYKVTELVSTKFTMYGETDPRAITAVTPVANISNWRSWKYAGTAKWSATLDNTRDTDHRDANWIIYRFADIKLMKAEALVMQGASNFPAAFELIQEIRTRATCGFNPNMPDNESDFVDLILDERLRELCFEGKRWFDLVRMARHNDGRYKDKLISIMLLNVAPKDRPLYEAKLQNEYGYYLPLNEKDINASGGLLIQNPYYL